MSNTLSLELMAPPSGQKYIIKFYLLDAIIRQRVYLTYNGVRHQQSVKQALNAMQFLLRMLYLVTKFTTKMYHNDENKIYKSELSLFFRYKL